MKYSLFAISIILVVCHSCKTTPSTTETTPPAITWNVANRTQKTSTDLTGNATYNAKYGDGLTITACGVDDGGVMQLVYTSSSFSTCDNGDGTVYQSAPLSSTTTLNLGLDADGKAWKKYCPLFNEDMKLCGTDGFVSGGAYINLKATNFSNLSASGSLTIHVTK